MEKVLAGYVGRLAPSPTGALHLGNARTFMIAYLRARSAGGKVILRIEDLDHPRDKQGAAAQAVEDLKWLGFDWDEMYVQSERKSIYREALALLPVYPCVCSRRDVENAQSAPHEGEQLFYSGTCRGRFGSWDEAAAFAGRTPCWRYRVEPDTVVEFNDVFAGVQRRNVSAELGDFPIARDAFGAGYTLAATVDDVLMGVTEVVRGDDLLPATPPQMMIAEKIRPWAASLCAPGRDCGEIRYCHVPLVVGPDGRRLAKRHGDTRIASYRAAGLTSEELIGRLASSCGLCSAGQKLSLKELVGGFSLERIPHEPVVMI